MADFGKGSYWEERYKEGDEKTFFDWLSATCDTTKDLIPFFASTSDKILNIGCGNSTQASDLYKLGYHNIINNDISHSVIEQMKVAHEQRDQHMGWECMDVFTMVEGANGTTDVPVTRPPFPRRSFDVVLDKGTMDALMCGFEGPADAARLVRNVARLLVVGGRYVLMTMGTTQTRLPLLTDSARLKGLHFKVEDKTPMVQKDTPDAEYRGCRAFILTKEAPDDSEGEVEEPEKKNPTGDEEEEAPGKTSSKQLEQQQKKNELPPQQSQQLPQPQPQSQTQPSSSLFGRLANLFNSAAKAVFEALSSLLSGRRQLKSK